MTTCPTLFTRAAWFMSVYSPGIAQLALIQRWIAEGLVVADGTLSDEQVAPGCLDKLVDRNIIELVMTLGAEAASCKVHGVMHARVHHPKVSFKELQWRPLTLQIAGNTCNMKHLNATYV